MKGMKQVLILLLAAAGFGPALFAQDNGTETRANAFRVSIGGGGAVTGNFSSWGVDKDVPGSLSRYNATQLSVEPYLFLDLKYLELNAGLLLGQLHAGDTEAGNPNFPAETLALHGGVYIKLPITLTPMFSLFPLLGLDYDLYLLATKDDKRDAIFPVSGTENASAAEALNTLWFKAGIGLDTFFTDHLFLRTELLYGIRLRDKMEDYFYNIRSDVKWMLGHGGNFKIAVGYRF